MKTIKYIFLFLLLSTLFYSCSRSNYEIKENDEKLNSNILFNPFNGWIKIVKKGCGPYGFARQNIYETNTYCDIRYEDKGFVKQDKLGTNSVKKRLYPYGNMVKAIHYAYKQISNGNLKGQEIMPKTHIRVRWKASSSDTLKADSEVLTW